MRTMMVGLACAAMLVSNAAAQTAYTYEYDVLGRLVRVERSTGASTRTRYSYDSVDNRTKVKQGVSAPNAVADGELVETTFGPWDIYPLFNDTDADLPFDALTITNLSGTGSGYGSIIGGNRIYLFGIPDGSYTWTYTIQDADGNSDNGTINLDVFHIDCGEFEC